MSFDWAEYLALAQELAGRETTPPTQEARLRSAVSRAYYAAFCKARNHLRDEEASAIPATGEAHRVVWEQFKGSSDRVRKEIGTNGDRLREDRRKADYEDTITNLSSLTSKALARGMQIISRLSKL